jgi:hypothetical protein
MYILNSLLPELLGMCFCNSSLATFPAQKMNFLLDRNFLEKNQAVMPKKSFMSNFILSKLDFGGQNIFLQ